MIARIWRGVVAVADADDYAGYLRETGIRAYRETPGNRGVLMLRRIVDGRAEFLLLTLWDSMDAVGRFAGDDVTRAVFYPEDDRYLIEKDLVVDHYDVLEGP